MTTTNKYKYSSVTLDSGPLLRSHHYLTPSNLLTLCSPTSYYTTPNVIAEIRDPKARLELKRIRDTVQHLGGESEGGEGKNVITDVPGWAVKAVSEFARRTGDYEVLSLTDLNVFNLPIV